MLCGAASNEYLDHMFARKFKKKYQCTKVGKCVLYRAMYLYIFVWYFNVQEADGSTDVRGFEYASRVLENYKLKR